MKSTVLCAYSVRHPLKRFIYACINGIVAAKRKLTHVFSRFRILRYSRSLQCPLRITS